MNMTTLKCFSSILSEDTVRLLEKNNIRTILDFLRVTPENIGRVLKRPVKNVIEMRAKLVNSFCIKPYSAADVMKQIHDKHFVLPTGIPQLDLLIGGLESGRIYEICGLSGSGKSRTCLSIAAHISSAARSILFIDTKNDFNASIVGKILRRKHDTDVTISMKRIQVAKAFSLHQLLNVLHWLQRMYEFCHIPLVIIDCISTCYYSYVGGEKPLGYAMLNHIASVIKYIVTQHHCVFLLTNIATKGFIATNDNAASPENVMKPCLGSYWQQISNVRLDFRRKNSCVVAISVGKSDSNHVDGTVNQVNLSFN